MAKATIFKGKCNENSATVLLNRVELASGANAAQADIQSGGIRVKVFNGTTEAPVGSDYLPAVGNVVYNTLQLDSRWTQDKTGYNFALPLAGSYFPDGQYVYFVEIKFTPTSGDPFYIIWHLQCQNILSE